MSRVTRLILEIQLKSVSCLLQKCVFFTKDLCNFLMHTASKDSNLLRAMVTS